MKKGFTLIELAIVLVVIGLLLGMAMKGRSLMESAQIKSDVNKLQKISAGYAIYYSKNNKRPGDNTSKSIVDNLTKDGTLTDVDFQTKLGGGYWTITGCSLEGEGKIWKLQSDVSTAPNVCVTIVQTDPATTDTIPSTAGSISQQFGCYIETGLDNKNFETGEGRGDLTMSNDIGWDCSRASDGTTGTYAYRIF